MKKILIACAVFLVLMASTAFSANFYSVQNGNWTDVNTWFGAAAYPNTDDTAWVNHYVNITWGMQANATNIFINSTGTLNVSGWANVTFKDTAGCGLTFINGTLDLNGSVDYPILINVLGIVPATDWGGAVSNLHVWFARFARFDNYAGLWENGGKLVWNNINFTNQASYLYTRALDAGTSITNTVLTNKWYFYQNAASYYFDNITVKSPGVLLLSNNVLGVTFNNLKIETNTFDAISFYQNTVNITLINLTNAGGLYARSTVDNVNLECYNCDTDVNSVFDAEAVYYRRMNFNNSNFTTTNWYLVTTPGSYIASRNHNSVANSWHGWFNQTNHTQIFGAMSLSDWGMTESDNVWMHGGILHIDENTNANNITIPAGSRINITVDDRLWVRENISNADLLLVNYGNLTAGNVTTESTGKFFAESSNITMNGIFNLSGTGYLSNTTLDMNLTSDGQFNITANSGSRLEIENYTKINSTSTGFEYLIDIKYGASFEMNNSRVEECGWDAADVGLTVSANNANITYNNITRGYMGLSILGNYSSILNNYVYNNSGYGIYLSGSLYNNFSNNNIFNNTLDNMRFSSSSNYNTILSNNISLSWGYGIRLAGSSSNNISYNNISSNHWDGVYGIIARYNNISHNTIFNNTLDGIDLRATSNYNNVTYNNVSGNGISGIYINSNYFLIASNNFSNNSYDGIEIYDSSYINVTDNIVYNNTYTGIRLNLSSWNNISNNTVTFNERGIRLENYCRNNNISNNNVSSNTIRGIHLYYGCDNSTIFNNNLQITNLGPINSSFIQIEDSYNINVTYNTLADNLCDDTSRCYGIALLYVNNTVISWNNIRNITSISIRLGEVVNGTVHNNTVYNTSWGQIYLGDSENVTVANNYLRNTDGHGMHLQSSNLLTIRDNIIGNLSGLRAPFRSGIMLHDTGNSTITNNTMSNITSVGILLNVTGTINNTAQNNTIFNSTYGIGVFSGAENNSFLYNTIYNCSYGLNVSNANISNHYFANSTISNSTFYEVALDTNSQVTLLNVTFNKSNTSIVNNSVLTLRWYVDIIAVHADYTPFENVLVRIRNVSGHQLNWELTNATGYIARKTLVEYEQTPTYKNDWNNHDFSGEFQALFGSNTSNITTNDVGSVYIVLAGGPPGGGGGAWKPKPGINISLCGNGKIDENETCENCAEDFEKLYGKGFCALPVAEAGGWPWWIILIFVGAYLIYKREELSERRRMYERKKLLGRAFISRRKKPVKSHVIYRKYRGY